MTLLGTKGWNASPRSSLAGVGRAIFAEGRHLLRHRGIRLKLLFSFMAVILLPLLSPGVIGPLISARTIEAEKISNTTQLIRQVTRDIEQRVRQIEGIVSILVEDPNVQNLLNQDSSGGGFTAESESGTRRLLHTITRVHPEIAGILIVNQPDRYLSNEIEPITRDPLSTEQWYLAAVEPRTSTVRNIKGADYQIIARSRTTRAGRLSACFRSTRSCGGSGQFGTTRLSSPA